MAEVTAGYLEEIRAAADYRVAAIGTDSLILIPQEKMYLREFNHLWYPPEKHDEVLALAKRIGMQVTS